MLRYVAGTHHEAKELIRHFTGGIIGYFQLDSEYPQVFKNAFFTVKWKAFLIMKYQHGTIKIKEKKEKEKPKSWRWLGCSENRWFESWKDLTPTQRSIMVSLWLYARNRGHCCPSERTLARRLKIGTKAICVNIKILKKKRYVRIEKQKGKYNRYFLLK